MAKFHFRKSNERKEIRNARREATLSKHTYVVPSVHPKDSRNRIFGNPLADLDTTAIFRERRPKTFTSLLDCLASRLQPPNRRDITLEKYFASFLQPGCEGSVTGDSPGTSLYTIDEADVSNEGARFVHIDGVRFQIMNPTAIASNPTSTSTPVTTSKREQIRARFRASLERLSHLPSPSKIHESLKSSIKKLSPKAKNGDHLTNDQNKNDPSASSANSSEEHQSSPATPTTNDNSSRTSSIHTSSESPSTSSSTSVSPNAPSAPTAPNAPKQTQLSPSELSRQLSLQIDTVSDPDVRVIVRVPIYDPSVPAKERWTSTRLGSSRPVHSWGTSKRWRCCKCRAATIVENRVCSNLKCEHHGCPEACKLVQEKRAVRLVWYGD